jgi:hypothetical protein
LDLEGVEGVSVFFSFYTHTLKSLTGLPVLARTIRNWQQCISAVILYGRQRRYGQILGIEINNDMFYDDDIITKYDRETGNHLPVL